MNLLMMKYGLGWEKKASEGCDSEVANMIHQLVICLLNSHWKLNHGHSFITEDCHLSTDCHQSISTRNLNESSGWLKMRQIYTSWSHLLLRKFTTNLFLAVYKFLLYIRELTSWTINSVLLYFQMRKEMECFFLPHSQVLWVMLAKITQCTKLKYLVYCVNPTIVFDKQ